MPRRGPLPRRETPGAWVGARPKDLQALCSWTHRRALNATYGQLPVAVTGCSAPVPHASLQVASAAHDIEHEPSQRISQVDPLPHEMLLLAPTVISQVAPLVQSTLHESPQVPVQVDSIAHASVQLSPSHAEPPRSHAASARALSRLCTTLHDPRDHANRAGEARAVEDSVRNHANPALAGSRVSEGGPAGA